MNSLYIELVERIRGEIPDLDRVVSRVLRSWNEGQRFLDRRDIYLDSVAAVVSRTVGFCRFFGRIGSGWGDLVVANG